jgi:hypothetical protein
VSHVVSSEVVIADLDILKRALTAFPKLKWMDGQKKYHWAGKWYDDYSETDAAYKRGIDVSQYGKSEHVLHMDNVQYEIGVTKRKDGTGYSLVWDFVGDGYKLSEYIGDNAEKLMCEYSRLYCENYALSAGYISNTTEDEDYFRVEMNQL